MSTPSDTNPQPATPQRWLLPAIVIAIVVLAGAVALLLTMRPAQRPGAIEAPTSDAAAAQEAHATAGVTELEPAHGSLDPNGPKVELISLSDAKARFDAGTALFVDVRAGSAYTASHIPGAVTITSEEIATKLAELPEGTAIIAYGDADRPESGQRGAQIFMQSGYPAMIALEGGFQGWEQAGYPVEK